jgi:hypothetical protein
LQREISSLSLCDLKYGDQWRTNMAAPIRSKVLFSDEDFKLLKESVRFWIQNHEESELTSKYAHLYHRLGTAAGNA